MSSSFTKYLLAVLIVLFSFELLSAQNDARLRFLPIGETHFEVPSFIFDAYTRFGLHSGISSFGAGSTTVADMPLAFMVEELPFFCKLEFQLEKATRFPVKFRLGEVQHTERLEGKR